MTTHSKQGTRIDERMNVTVMNQRMTMNKNNTRTQMS